MLITIQQFTLPCDNLADGTYTLRTWYPQGYLDSSGQSVASGTATTGLQLRSDVNVSGGFMTFDPYTVYSTLDAQVPQPQSLKIQCQVFKGNTALPVNPFNQSGTPSSWIVPDDLGATISFEEWTIANQAIQLYYYQPNWYTQAQVDALIAANNVQVAFNQDYAIGQYASFAAAVAAAAVTDGTLVINEATTTGTQTVPANVTLRFTRKGSLTVTTGQTVHILGSVEADPVQIFFNANSGQGTVSFANNTAIFGVVPNWWFTNSTPGTTDVTSGFNAAIATGQTVLIPEGTYGVTSLSVTTGSQILKGAGPEITYLKGLGSGKMINLSGAAARAELRDFTLDGNNTASHGVYLSNGVSRATLSDLEIFHCGEGVANQGALNYLTQIVGCEIEGNSVVGIRLIKAVQGSVIDRSKLFFNETGVILGDGLQTVFDISITNCEIEMASTGGAKTNIVCNNVMPLLVVSPYFESAAHVNSLDIDIEGESIVTVIGGRSTGNNIADYSIAMFPDTSVHPIHLSLIGYTMQDFVQPVPINNLADPNTYATLQSVQYVVSNSPTSPTVVTSQVVGGDFSIASGRIVENVVAIAALDTSPDVTTGNIFVYSTAAPLSITQFDNGSEGQTIEVINASASNLTLVSSANFVFPNSADIVLTQGCSVTLVKIGTKWYLTDALNNLSVSVTGRLNFGPTFSWGMDNNRVKFDRGSSYPAGYYLNTNATDGIFVDSATSKLLELVSTTGALLVSRMTTTQKNALTAVNGMIVYDTDLAKLQGYQAGSWQNLI